MNQPEGRPENTADTERIAGPVGGAALRAANPPNLVPDHMSGASREWLGQQLAGQESYDRAVLAKRGEKERARNQADLPQVNL